MQAAYVDDARTPAVGRFPEPTGRDGTVLSVRAAALTNLDMLVASGRHYFSTGRLPAVIGREGIGVDADGRRFFATARAIAAPFGSMAARMPVDPALCLPVPDGIDDAPAAALGNAGLAAWLPLSWRGAIEPGETVLIVGATGATGSLAVAAAAMLGAGRVVAAGRDRAALDRLRHRGATDTVVLDGAADLPDRLRAACGEAHLVVDYVNGTAAEAALTVMATHGRMVQVGSIAAPAMRLDAQTARRQCLDILGFAYYHAPIDAQRAAYRAICQAAIDGRLTVDHETVPLSRFIDAWERQRAGDRRRLVVVPDPDR